jgi:hypothetical protein
MNFSVDEMNEMFDADICGKSAILQIYTKI